jgi:hypothetical protein
MDNFAKAGGTIYVCWPCIKKRKLDENNLVAAIPAPSSRGTSPGDGPI